MAKGLWAFYKRSDKPFTKVVKILNRLGGKTAKQTKEKGEYILWRKVAPGWDK